jgi:predicted RNA methylase
MLFVETISKHYNEKYFAFQRSIGEFGGWANTAKFEKYIQSDSDVLDFGCGGGFLLKQLGCRKNVGVEVNPIAQKIARENQIEVYTALKTIQVCR